MEKDISVIPFGQYCYTDLTPDGPNLKIKLCPYWSLNKEREYQENGYCSYLEVGDWQEEAGFGLLWDQVKLCNINEEWLCLQ